MKNGISLRNRDKYITFDQMHKHNVSIVSGNICRAVVALGTAEAEDTRNKKIIKKK